MRSITSNGMNGDFEVKQLEPKPVSVLKKKMKQPGDLKEAISEAVMEKARKLMPYVLIFLVLVAAGFATYFWYEAQALKKNPQRAAQEETLKLIGAISKLIVLPEGENPTIATVTDPERLREQPFFAKAKTGDKVLIYTNSRKAILYNPTQNKIIEVAPINIGNPQTP